MNVITESQKNGIHDQPIVKNSKRSIIVLNRVTRDEIAEYQISPDSSVESQMSQIRRAIKKHLGEGGVIGNYQW